MLTRSSDPNGWQDAEYKKFRACGSDSSSSDSDSDTSDEGELPRPRAQNIRKPKKYKNIAKIEPLVPE
jgi:hypothetical protein